MASWNLYWLLPVAIGTVASSLAAGCSDDTVAVDGAMVDGASLDAQVVADAAVDAAVDATPGPDASIFPLTLAETGLYSDFGARTIASDVEPYIVAYPLWSDGAEKRRWVHIPEGTSIDTSNMDFWSYPVGTKLWKEFRQGELLLETRLLWKMGPERSDWFYMSYGWNEAQTEAVEFPDGATDVLGTSFDIPEQRDCRKCHEKQPDYVLGFTTLQLDHSEPGVTLETLATDSLLSDNPPGQSPYYPLPGSDVEKAALGYMHGNCGGCHHPTSIVQDTTNLVMRLEVASLGTVEETTSYTTMVGIKPQLATKGFLLVDPGQPLTSVVHKRMSERDTQTQMPPRGTDVVDTEGLALVDAWINSIAP